MDWQEFFRHFAVYGLALNVLFGIVLSIRTKHLDASATSQLGASSKSNYLIFAVGVTLVGILTSFSVYGYLRQDTSIPDLFYILFAIAISMLVLTAWIPDSKGLIKRLHFYAAYIMFYMYLSLSALLFVGSYDYVDRNNGIASNLADFMGIVFPLALAFVGAYIHEPIRKNREKLRAQQLYILTFQIALIVRIYL